MSWSKLHSQSRKNNNKRYQREYNRTRRGLWNKLVSRAREKNISLTIDYQLFDSLFNEPCFYCGGLRINAGLDRIDNSIGYTPDNIRPCCWPCNRMKGASTEEEFLTRCRAISNKLAPL